MANEMQTYMHLQYMYLYGKRGGVFQKERQQHIKREVHLG